ncbi:uncharacterized protein LOC141684204 isoform X3 [Apium graveolens]|uniref:uncharacterized protein LOC141684204 isoform X3 n=1 Tax=Apium graveolens TaxID=4045 RepID=UPI003D7BB486
MFIFVLSCRVILFQKHCVYMFPQVYKLKYSMFFPSNALVAFSYPFHVKFITCKLSQMFSVAGSQTARWWRRVCNYKRCQDGDNNEKDDRILYPPGQLWLQRHHIMGRAVGFLPYVGWVTIIMTEKLIIKHLDLLFSSGQLFCSGKRPYRCRLRV